MEALLALARSYGKARTKELSSWKLFNREKTYLVPSILTNFLNIVPLCGHGLGGFLVLSWSWVLFVAVRALFSFIYYVAMCLLNVLVFRVSECVSI